MLRTVPAAMVRASGTPAASMASGLVSHGQEGSMRVLALARDLEPYGHHVDAASKYGTTVPPAVTVQVAAAGGTCRAARGLRLESRAAPGSQPPFFAAVAASAGFALPC